MSDDFILPGPAEVLSGESTSARLRRVEQERDKARAGLSNALKCFDDLQTAAGRKYQAYEAELASARTELELLRARLAAQSTTDRQEPIT